jgi:hypothetical protein
MIWWLPQFRVILWGWVKFLEFDWLAHIVRQANKLVPLVVEVDWGIRRSYLLIACLISHEKEGARRGSVNTIKIMNWMSLGGCITVLQIQTHLWRMRSTTNEPINLTVWSSQTCPLHDRWHFYYGHGGSIKVSLLSPNRCIHAQMSILPIGHFDILVLVSYHHGSRMLLYNCIPSVVALALMVVLVIVLMIVGVERWTHKMNTVLLMRYYVMRVHCTVEGTVLWQK